MEVLIFLFFICFGSSYAVDRAFLVDQANSGIYFSDIDPGQLLTEQKYERVSLENIRAPGVMTYDYTTNKVIWAQRDPHKISADTLDGVPNATDVFLGIKPSCITFNDYDRRIYWFGNVSRLLNSIHINGTGKIRLAKKKRHLYGLSVDGSKGFLYYAELDRIVRMKVDGSEETVLVDSNLTNVTAFTRNSQDGCLYWINEPGIIERYDTLTNERSTLHNISTLVGRIWHIVVYNGVFYWSDPDRGGIGYVDLQDPSINGFLRNKTVRGFVHTLAAIVDMKVFINEEVDYCSSSPCSEGTICENTRLRYVCYVSNSTVNTSTEVTEQRTNPCERLGDEYPCDDLHGSCMNENGTASCSCEPGYYLTDDGVTCKAHVNCTYCTYGECLHNDGIYRCICYAGSRNFDGEDGHCEDINECENSPCDPDYGECVNTVGAYYCSCVQGFAVGGDGVTCYEEKDLEGDGEYEHVGRNCSESESSDHDDDPELDLSTTAIVIITVIIVLTVFIIIVIIVACCRRKKNNKDKQAA